MITHPTDFRMLRYAPFWVKAPVLFLCILALQWCFEDIHKTPEPLAPGEPMKAYAFVTALVVSIVLAIIAELLRPKPDIEDARPTGLGDIQAPTATEGRVVPLIFGRNLVQGPNCTWYGDLEYRPITETVRTGWFSKETFVSGYSYHLGFQFALCRGNADGTGGVELVRLWTGPERKYLVYDGTVSGIISGESRVDVDEPELYLPQKGGVQTSIDFFPGSYTQSVSTFLDDADRQRPAPLSTAPRYAGTAYMVFRELTEAAATTSDTGAYIGNSASIDAWQFELQRFSPLFPGQSAGEHLVPASTGVDCNPMNVIYEILTNSEWGLGFGSSEIDTTTFVTLANTLESEGNGFSMVLDRELTAVKLLEEVERQIDGVVFLSQVTGLWTCKLARNDYNIASIPAFTEANSKYTDYIQGTWEDTTNQVTVRFNKRDDDYKESYAVAHAQANILTQGAGTVLTGKVVKANVVFPGCKLSALANELVWRSLRNTARPLSRVTFEVDRNQWDLTPVDVIKWSNTNLGIVEQPYRVLSVDFGTLESNKITIQAVEDIWQYRAGLYADPQGTNWNEPTFTVSAIPSDEQFAMEAPRGLVVREPDYAGDPTVAKIFAGGRRQGPEIAIDITERHASGTPSGTFATAGSIGAFMRIGSLAADLNAGSAYPLSALTITPSPDSQAALESVFADATTVETLGTELTQLLLVGTEFMLVQSASDNGANVDLENVYRGALDTAQQNHSSGADVFLVFVGAALADSSLPNTDNVHVRLLPRSITETLASGSATQINFAMNKRAIKPYPPSGIQYNGGGVTFDTPDLEGDGSGLNGFGIAINWLRRLIDGADEIAGMDVDADPDGAANVSNTEYFIEVRESPFSGGDVIWDSTECDADGWISGNDLTDGSGPDTIALRTKLLNGALNAALAEWEFRIRVRHDYDGDTALASIQELIHRATPDSTLSGQVAMGQATWSNPLPTAYVAAATGTYTINIGSAFSTGNVQYRLNGGSWTTSFAAGLTTGTIPGVTATDTIELRHDANDGAQINFVELQNPSATAVAYGLMLS